MKILMCSDDPDTILSYGLLSDMLIDKWYKKHEIHYVSLQYQIGKPFPRRDENGNIRYIKHPAHNEGQRNPKNLSNVINNTNPNILWTNFDIQHYLNVKNYVPKGVNWVGWVPWDNHDPNQIPRAKSAFENVDIRVAISKFGMGFLRQHGIEVEDYIYNCVNTDVFRPLPDNHPDIMKFKELNPWYNEGTKLLLFVGRPNWRKRMLYMFSIIRELKDRGNDDVKLFLHSSLDDPSSEAPLRKVIDAFDLKDNIANTQFFWDSGVSQLDLRVIYNLADIYIAPHGGEGFGMPIVESMACGTPFVASDICTTREFAGPNFERGLPSEVNWPVTPNGQPVLDKGVYRSNPDVEAFADKVEQLLMDERRRKRMGNNGIKWVRENCSPGVVSKKWEEIFDIYNIPIAAPQGYK